MGSVRKNREALWKALVEVYRHRKKAKVDEKWRQDVMRNIRLIDLAGTVDPDNAGHGVQFTGKGLIPAAGAALIVLVIMAVVIMTGTEMEPDLVALTDPLDVVVAQLFWP